MKYRVRTTIAAVPMTPIAAGLQSFVAHACCYSTRKERGGFRDSAASWYRPSFRTHSSGGEVGLARVTTRGAGGLYGSAGRRIEFPRLDVPWCRGM